MRLKDNKRGRCERREYTEREKETDRGVEVKEENRASIGWFPTLF